jgi:hypothetical protein
MWAVSSVNQTLAQRWIDQLIDWHPGSWFRVVLDSPTGQVPGLPPWHSAIKQLAIHATGPCLTMPRLWQSDEFSYQLWVSNRADLCTTVLMFGPALHVREFDHEQFVEHLTNKLSWLKRF